jgi:hypothetical protein
MPPFFEYIHILVLIKCLQFLPWHSSYSCSWKAHLCDFCGLFCRCPIFRSMYLGRHCRKCLIETQFAPLFPKQWVSYSSTIFWNLFFSTNFFTRLHRPTVSRRKPFMACSMQYSIINAANLLKACLCNMLGLPLDISNQIHALVQYRRRRIKA